MIAAGVLSGNDAATWPTFSNGRVDGALDVTRRTRLPKGFSWVSAFSGVLAGQPLPDTVRLSLGGLYATRGYDFDDASADSGFVWRNELRAPALSPLSQVAGQPDALSPYLFNDLGYGFANLHADQRRSRPYGGGRVDDSSETRGNLLSAAFPHTM